MMEYGYRLSKTDIMDPLNSSLCTANIQKMIALAQAVKKARERALLIKYINNPNRVEDFLAAPLKGGISVQEMEQMEHYLGEFRERSGNGTLREFAELAASKKKMITQHVNNLTDFRSGERIFADVGEHISFIEKTGKFSQEIGPDDDLRRAIEVIPDNPTGIPVAAVKLALHRAVSFLRAIAKREMKTKESDSQIILEALEEEYRTAKREASFGLSDIGTSIFEATRNIMEKFDKIELAYDNLAKSADREDASYGDVRICRTKTFLEKRDRMESLSRRILGLSPFDPWDHFDNDNLDKMLRWIEEQDSVESVKLQVEQLLKSFDIAVHTIEIEKQKLLGVEDGTDERLWENTEMSIIKLPIESFIEGAVGSQGIFSDGINKLSFKGVVSVDSIIREIKLTRDIVKRLVLEHEGGRDMHHLNEVRSSIDAVWNNVMALKKSGEGFIIYQIDSISTYFDELNACIVAQPKIKEMQREMDRSREQTQDAHFRLKGIEAPSGAANDENTKGVTSAHVSQSLIDRISARKIELGMHQADTTQVQNIGPHL